MNVSQFDLGSPAQLVGLLVGMARNKLLMQARAQTRQKRDVGRVVAVCDDMQAAIDTAPSPVRAVAARELLSVLLDRLGPTERELAQRRAVDQAWDDIARDLGGTPQGHRMRLTRAIERLAPELGLDGGPAEDDR